MGYKKKDETEGRKHNPARVAACIEEYHRWLSHEDIYSARVKMYYGLYDGLSKYYPTFYDYYMEHNKTCTDKHYYEIWKDKSGNNRQTIMYPTLDDNDNIVYRVRDQNHDISDTTRIGHEEPAEQEEEIDERTNSVVIDMTNKFNPNRRR